MVWKIILMVLNIPLVLYSAYFLVFFLVGIFRKKQIYSDTEKRTHFAVLIPARNEESVIATLMDSLEKLDYPKDCFDTYVLLHNCTDNTEEIVQSYGARTIRRGAEMKTKGEVLKSVFDELNEHEEIDAYVIIDADNAISPNFLTEVNKAVVGGAQVIQGRRTGRNSRNTWVAGCYEIYYRMQNAFYNRPRIGIRCSAAVNGSGWAVTKDVIQMNGFDVKTIAEDIEYTSICALDGLRITYLSNAISADQFVSHLRLSMTQRVRWTYGMFQCIRLYEGKLLRQAFRGSFEALDLSLVNLMLISTFYSLILIPTGFLSLWEFFPLQEWLSIPLWAWFLIYLVVGVVGYYIFTCFAGLLSVLLTRGNVRENLKGIFGFPVFLVTWIPVIVYCLFKRRVDWKPMRSKAGSR